MRVSSGLLLVVAALASGCAAENTGSPDAAASGPIDVVFLSHTARSGMETEEAAAWDWLSAQPDVVARLMQLEDLPDTRLEVSSVLWWHYASAAPMPSAAIRGPVTESVRQHLDAGGSLLLSLLATPWLLPLDLESQGPDSVGLRVGTDWARWGPSDDRILAGFQSRRGHPLLRRFWGSAFTAWMRPDEIYASAAWTGDNWPAGGSVLAVGRRYIRIDPDRRVIVEYPPGPDRPGHVLAVGEGMYFADAGNPNRRHLELFARDTLGYLAGRLPPAPPGARVGSTGAAALPADTTMAGSNPPPPEPPGGSDAAAATVSPVATALPEVLARTTYWEPATTGTRRFTPTAPTAREVHLDEGDLERVLAARSGLALERERATGEPFDLYSPRNLLVGTDDGRIDELWGYPTRVLRDLRFGIVAEDGDVRWLDAADQIRFTARPEGNSFRYALDEATIDLHVAVPRNDVGLVVVISATGPGPLRIRATWRADNAVMWPREPEYPGELLLGWSATDGSATWRGTADEFEVSAGFSVPPVGATIGGLDAMEPEPESDAIAEAAATGGEISSGAESGAAPPAAPVATPTTPLGEGPDAVTRRIELDALIDSAGGAPVAFVVAARTAGGTTPREAFAATLADPAAVWTANANYWARFLTETVAIASPDPTVNEAFRWAKVGLEAFRVTSPGIGTGLAAGYAAAARAEEDSWAAENDFLRRPGYAWYFGRDGVWTALAADAYGGSDLAREALRLLARYQDVDGKIFHELSPTGVAHYDAADSTPLFLLGLENHIRATGDRELLRELWPTVRAAMQFLVSTDTDGDGLIENTNVGHGWIEGGRFYGAHTTFYLAGIWAATLDAVDRMAGWMADTELGQLVDARQEMVAGTLDEVFWDPVQRYYRHGLRADGTTMAQRTILPAVPTLLGVLDRDKIRPMIETFGSADLTTDWGTRMTGRSNPDYNPVGYHDGSVWPLYTGWTSLAAYQARRPLTGFLHAYSNLRLIRQGSLGHITEVLNGDLFATAGVTSHQAWSHALTVLPVLQGALGLRPDAVNGTLEVHPQLPGDWREVRVQRVRVGSNAFDIDLRREDESTAFTISRVAGNDAIQFNLQLSFPRATLVNLDHDNTTGMAIPEGEDIVDYPPEKLARVLATLTGTQGVVTFRHSPFPEVVQPLPTPVADAPSSALRIVESRFSAGALNIRLEGLPGRPYRFAVATPWRVRSVAGPRGAAVVNPGPGRAQIEVVIPGSGTDFQRTDLTVEFVR